MRGGKKKTSEGQVFVSGYCQLADSKAEEEKDERGAGICKGEKYFAPTHITVS
jgi:hypothetical protein